MAFRKLFLVLGAVFCMTMQDVATAQNEQASGTSQRRNYHFKLKDTPAGMASTDYAMISFAGNKVFTLRGEQIAKQGDEIIDVKESPAGINFAVLSKNKKENELCVYSTTEADKRLFKLNDKKYGNPTAVAYTADARRLLVATSLGLKIFDARNFALQGERELPFTVESMVVSPNGNFLAITNGTKVDVYNFEDWRTRKTWTFEEGVSSMEFSRDNNSFAVLTPDGILYTYDSKTFALKKAIEELGDGIDAVYNFDSKYMAVATTPDSISLVNLLDESEREFYPADSGMVNKLAFIIDYQMNPILAYTTKKAIDARRMENLAPYYGKLIADEVSELMNEWLKMMPGETMEEYRERVSDANRERQMRLFEEQVSTRYAGDMISMSTITLGKYDRSNQLLELGFSNMPSILLPVPETEVTAFQDVDKLEFSYAKYGILPNDNFELIYAQIHNGTNGIDYVYDNLDRKPLQFMGSDNDFVSIEILQQQQMEELRLQELRERVIEEAKKQNVITDHTHIAVDSRIVPDYNADGEKILNYQVNFSYEVEPGFSAQEDFAPGKYVVGESGAASSMLSIIKQAFEGDLAQYLVPGKKLRVKIYGNADGTPIARVIPYNGAYGDIDNELVYQNNQLTGVSVNKKSGITQNEQLAFLRAYGVTDFLEHNVEALKDMNKDYQYYIDVLEDKGGEFRRITAEFTIIDVF